MPKAFKGSLRYSAMQEECNWGGCNTGLQKASTSTNPYSFQTVLQGPHMWFTTEIISGFGPRYTILRCLQRGVKNNTRLTSIPKEQSLVALILIITMTTKTPQFSHSRESLQSSVRQVLAVALRTRVSATSSPRPGFRRIQRGSYRLPPPPAAHTRAALAKRWRHAYT